jgi:hypothetical protein
MLSAQKRLCRAFMPHRPGAVQCLAGGAVARRAPAKTYRLYNCYKCNKLVFIGPCCDHGNIYCKKCREDAHKEAGRRKSARYQGKRKGKHNHAARMKRWRWKKKQEKDQVFTAIEAARRLRARCRRARRRQGRCDKTHHKRVCRQRPSIQERRRQQVRCSRAHRPEAQCQRAHSHQVHCRGHQARRQPAPCRKTRHRRTRCLPIPSPDAGRDRSAGKLEKVTHPGCAGLELGPNVSGSTPSTKEHPDDCQAGPVRSLPARQIARCSFCGRALPPYTRTYTWWGSG